MDFEFSPEQEMLRTSVRAFLGAKAPLRRSGPGTTRRLRPSAWDGLVDLGVVGRAGRGGLRRRGDRDGRCRGRARGTRPRGLLRSVRVVGDRRGGARRRRACSPRWPDGSTIGTVAIFEAGNPLRMAHARDARHARRRRRGRSTEQKVHVADAVAAGVVLVTALDDDGQLGVFATEEFAAEPTPTVDGSRKQGRITLRRRAGPADRRRRRRSCRRRVRSTGSALPPWSTVWARRSARSSSRSSTRRSASSSASRSARSRPCSTCARTCCARSSSVGPRATTRAGPSTTPRPKRRTARPRSPARSRPTPSRSWAATAIQIFGGIGFTWEHDIHLYYKRLLTVASEFGTAADHLEELATLAID